MVHSLTRYFYVRVIAVVYDIVERNMKRIHKTQHYTSSIASNVRPVDTQDETAGVTRPSVYSEGTAVRLNSYPLQLCLLAGPDLS